MSLDALEPLLDDATARAFAAFRRSPREPGFDPYYAQEIPRFELRDDDVLVTPADASATRAACGVALVSDQAHARVEACGVSETEARSVLASIDGTRTAGAAREHSSVSRDAWDRIVRAGFGTVLFAPLAVASLERRVSGTEIVRFAGSPYEIVRSYWENMASVASRLEHEGGLDGALASAPAFVRLLRELHVLALAGESGRSFYRPASPTFEREEEGPGDFLRTESVVEQSEEGCRFVAGPRVGAGLIGGAHYHALLTESVGDAEALAPARAISDDAGLSWGRVVTARADADASDAPWFCPPRPLTDAHLDALRAHLSEALGAAPDRAIPALSRFHWSFARLHPFAFANQSVAMSLVNHALRRARGAGIPHHVLDHLALRLSRAAYAQVFDAAVRGWLVRDESPVRRTFELVRRKRRAFDLLRALEHAESPSAARAIVAERREDALLVLLR